MVVTPHSPEAPNPYNAPRQSDAGILRSLAAYYHVQAKPLEGASRAAALDVAQALIRGAKALENEPHDA